MEAAFLQANWSGARKQGKLDEAFAQFITERLAELGGADHKVWEALCDRYLGAARADLARETLTKL